MFWNYYVNLLLTFFEVGGGVGAGYSNIRFKLIYVGGFLYYFVTVFLSFFPVIGFAFSLLPESQWTHLNNETEVLINVLLVLHRWCHQPRHVLAVFLQCSCSFYVFTRPAGLQKIVRMTNGTFCHISDHVDICHGHTTKISYLNF